MGMSASPHLPTCCVFISSPLQKSSYEPVFSHGVRVSPLGTAATVWPTVPAPDDR